MSSSRIRLCPQPSAVSSEEERSQTQKPETTEAGAAAMWPLAQPCLSGQGWMRRQRVLPWSPGRSEAGPAATISDYSFFFFTILFIYF